MRSLRVQLQRQTLIQGLVVVGLALNMALFLGGIALSGVGASHRSDVSPEKVAALRSQVLAMEERRQQLWGISAEEALNRALALYLVAEERGVQIVSLTNENRRERFGRQELQAFVTSLEIRGPREPTIALLGEIPAVLQGNALITNVDARGTLDSFAVRFTVFQVIQS